MLNIATLDSDAVAASAAAEAMQAADTDESTDNNAIQRLPSPQPPYETLPRPRKTTSTRSNLKSR